MSTLTRGQLLAREQLPAIAAGSAGALTVSSVADAPDVMGWLTIAVRLDIAPTSEEQRAKPPDGGVQLERHENAIIHIPPDFPLRRPAVEVLHDRFAGLPHVQWGRWICLYHSAADWDPAEGMMGVVIRLSAWYRRAAVGHLDAPGQPLDPPIAYTSSWAGCLVIHENAPRRAEASGGEPWLGAAILWPGGDGRVDLVAWLSKREQLYQDTARLYEWLDEQEFHCGMPLFLGPAVILPGPMTFEFPSTVGDLVDAVARQGVTATELALLLGDVAWINRVRAERAVGADAPRVADRPLYALVGSPMRGIAGSSARLIHLAAWRLGGEEADLAAALAQLWASPNPDRTEQDGLIIDAVNDWIDDAEVSWARVYELRPEIVERRDDKPAARWLRGDDGSGRRVTVLGCGALGAPIAEQCLRAGIATLTLVDSGRVSPGVLVRQLYEDADIGQPKATALEARLRRVRPEADIDPRVGDALSTVLSDCEPPDTDLLIDATASQTVAARIEQCRWMSRAPWPPVLTVTIGHLAERGVATLALPHATGAHTDMMRKLALATRTAPHLADVADDFFPNPPRATIFQPEPGCSEPTFRGSATEVQALASQLLAGAMADLQGKKPDSQAAAAPGLIASASECAGPSMSARIARLPYADNSDCPDRVTWFNDHPILDPGSGYQIRFSPAALDAMQDEAYGVMLIFGPDVETGGILLGQIDDVSQVIWVTSAIGPPPDSQRASSHIKLGIAGTAELLAAIERRSGGRSRFIGMWHTHPCSAPFESQIDSQTMAGLLADADHPVHRALLVVLGGSAEQWGEWLEGQALPAIYTRLCR
jgi:ThiF family/Prokaryotic E2 family A/Prokaryotic homologs of the JAB domain